MPSRRRVLAGGLQVLAGAAAARSGLSLGVFAEAQQTGNAEQHPDEMTLNSAPQQRHYPPPDFGPPPAQLPPQAPQQRGRNSLRAHAQHHGLIAGAAVVVKGLESDPALQQLVAEQYGILVPESELKWVALRPDEQTFDFAPADALFAFAAKHHMRMRGHTLVWHNSVPDWLRENADHLNVRQLLVQHIETVMRRYRGRVQSWDVVNEAILPADEQPGDLRKSFWYQAVGPDYIELAYRAARKADPHAKLCYNDYGVEYDSDEDTARRATILALLRRLRERGVPLDAVGIQSHIKAGSPYTIGKGLTDYMEAIRSLGLEIYLTEMDVNEDDLPYSDMQHRDQTVAETYRQFLDVALANPAVKLMLTWGVSDRRTWLNDGPTHHRKRPDRPQRSLPFDPQYRPTPAFFAIRNSFDARRVG